MKKINKKWHNAFKCLGINHNNQKKKCIFVRQYSFSRVVDSQGNIILMNDRSTIYQSRVLTVAREIQKDLVEKKAKISISGWYISCSYLNKKKCSSITQNLSLKIDAEIHKLIEEGFEVDYSEIPLFLFIRDKLPWSKVVTEILGNKVKVNFKDNNFYRIGTFEMV